MDNPLLILVFAVATLALQQSLDQQARINFLNSQQAKVVWRPATKKDCDEETERQYAEMAREKWCCDPPITMGFSVMSWGADGVLSGHSESPCGYISNQNPPDFAPRYTVWKHGVEREAESQEAFWRMTCANVYSWDSTDRTIRISPKPEWTECREQLLQMWAEDRRRERFLQRNRTSRNKKAR